MQLVQDENATQDVDMENMGIKVVSGDISLVLSQGNYEASDEDRDNSGGSISYKMPNGMTLVHLHLNQKMIKM